MGRGSGHDDGWGDAGFIFANAFEDALTHLRRGGAVQVGGVAKDDKGVKMCGGSVPRRNEKSIRGDERSPEKGACEQKDQDAGGELHTIIVATKRCRRNDPAAECAARSCVLGCYR